MDQAFPAFLLDQQFRTSLFFCQDQVVQVLVIPCALKTHSVLHSCTRLKIVQEDQAPQVSWHILVRPTSSLCSSIDSMEYSCHSVGGLGGPVISKPFSPKNPFCLFCHILGGLEGPGFRQPFCQIVSFVYSCQTFGGLGDQVLSSICAPQIPFYSCTID